LLERQLTGVGGQAPEMRRAAANYEFSAARRLLHRTVVIGTAPY